MPLEHTISDLHDEIDRLTRLTPGKTSEEGAPDPLEPSSSDFSQRGRAILDHWAETDRRYAEAVREMEARLSDWHAIESRLRQESLERMRAFEQTIAREWKELRELHEEPLKQLREQASALGETSVAAANLALRGYERAEARLSSLEADLRTQLSQLTRDVHTALAEMRRERTLGPHVAPVPFQLESVLRIHDELREPDPLGSLETAEPGEMRPAEFRDEQDRASAVGVVGAVNNDAPQVVAADRRDEPGDSDGSRAPISVTASPAARAATMRSLPVTPVPAVRLAARATAAVAAATVPDSLPPLDTVPRSTPADRMHVVFSREASSRSDEAEERPEVNLHYPRRGSRLVPVVVFIGIVTAGVIGVIGLQHDPEPASLAAYRPAVLPAAPLPVSSNSSPSSPEPQAQAGAALAADVITAGDVIRFAMIGAGAGRGASGQVLWSRSRGLVLTASGVPSPEPGSVYRVWLLSDAQAVAVADVAPDETGRVRLATRNPDALPTLVDSILVTAEPAGPAGAKPAGAPILRRPLS